jgi:glucose/arabinose dehydrogenase
MSRRRLLTTAAWLVLAACDGPAPRDPSGAPPLADVPEFGLRVAGGFRVTRYADHTLANDVYCLTVDSRGRVVAGSNGWIKTLHDADGDGRADRAETLAEVRYPTGLFFDGNDLYYTGDDGLNRLRDADADGRADGPKEHLLDLDLGEHGAHAIRKGPDGWFYLVGGNDAGINPCHVTLPDSPVRVPQAGAVLRLSPDGKRSEVIAHGFRNPYDLDFNPDGDLFTYDADGERDFFLPWYLWTFALFRPVR